MSAPDRQPYDAIYRAASQRYQEAATRLAVWLEEHESDDQRRRLSQAFEGLYGALTVAFDEVYDALVQQQQGAPSREAMRDTFRKACQTIEADYREALGHAGFREAYHVVQQALADVIDPEGSQS